MTKRNIFKIDVSPAAFTLLGVSSHENDYRLSWNLNEHLHLGLAQTENFISGTGQEFSCFAWEDENNSTILLISNRCDNGFLLDKYKNIDFILKIDPELTAEDLSTWQNKLKKVPLVSATFPIPINKTILQILG